MYKINKIAHKLCAIFVHFVEFFGKTEKAKISVDNGIGRVYNKSVNKRCLCYKGERDKMNILEYIDDLISQGYSEEEAERCADCMFSDIWESDDCEYYDDSDGYYGD